ncbi:hypothetical protein H2200_007720 [Cladophialophora chaetospira]|uniref:Xylanolytic transcriptional activator regulatory domain-containing protein n=1 Tax=Cladophialophora chaetospira TaxID=386627 RepID=A0AA38X6A6_9EURO|nr:hypothetical protein H2200_007720 [Cladophialophora chaetospira]
MAASRDLFVIAPTQPRKRVMVACDYCRKKRVRAHIILIQYSIPLQDPCNNCQLYGAKCTKSSGRSWRGRHVSSRVDRGGKPGAVSSRDKASSDHPVPSSSDNKETSRAKQVTQEPVCIPPSSRLSNKVSHEVWCCLIVFTTQNEALSGDCLPLVDDGTRLQEISWTGSTLPNNPIAFFSQSDPWDLSLSYHDRAFTETLFETEPLMTISAIGTQEPRVEGDASSSRWTFTESPNTQHDPGEDKKSRKEDTVRKYHVWLPKLELPQPSTQSQIVPGLFVESATSKSGYLGRHSIGGTLASCIRDAHERNSDLQKPAFNFLSKAAYYVDKAQDHGLQGGFEYDLPLKSFAARSIEAYFRHVHVVYPILDEETFLACWEQLYDQQSSNRDVWMSIWLCLVVAIGAVCDNPDSQIARQAEQISKSLHEQVWTLTHRALHNSSIEAVQAILLHIIFLLHRGKMSVAWTLCGMAIRISQVHGLHRKFPSDLERPQKEVQLRSQIWWTAFSLDASCSMAEGRPPAAWEEDCDVEILPLYSVSTTNNEEDSDDVLSALYIRRIRMAQMENRFCRVLSRRETMIDKLGAIAEIDKTLIEWRDGLPNDYRPEQEILVRQDTYQIVALLHLKYFSLMRAIHWVSIDCSLGSGDESTAGQYLHPRLRASEAICLGAARAFINVLNKYVPTFKAQTHFSQEHVQELLQAHLILELGTDKIFIASKTIPGKNVFFPSPYHLHTDQYMATLAILYRNILKNPGRTSAKSDLEHFRAAKEYLERDLFHENYEPKLGATMKAVFEQMMGAAETAIETTRAISRPAGPLPHLKNLGLWKFGSVAVEKGAG